MKTREEVEELKRQYINDPIFEVWEVEGFEDYKHELRNWAEKLEEKWEKEARNRVYQRARKLNCSVELVEYIQQLEYRLELMQDRLDRLENYSG